MENLDGTGFQRTARSVLLRGLDAAFLVERATEIAYQRYELFTMIGTSTRTSGKTLQSLSCPDTLLQHWFEELTDFTLSTFSRVEELQGKSNQTLQSLVTDVGDEQPDRNDQDAAGAQYSSTQELETEYLEGTESQA